MKMLLSFVVISAIVIISGDSGAVGGGVVLPDKGKLPSLVHSERFRKFAVGEIPSNEFSTIYVVWYRGAEFVNPANWEQLAWLPRVKMSSKRDIASLVKSLDADEKLTSERVKGKALIEGGVFGYHRKWGWLYFRFEVYAQKIVLILVPTPDGSMLLPNEKFFGIVKRLCRADPL